MKTMETLQQKESQMNVKEANNKNSFEGEIKRENVKNTPFQIVSMEGYHFGIMGDYRLTEKNNNKKEVKKELSEITWNRLIQVMMILNEVKEKLNNKLNKEEK